MKRHMIVLNYSFFEPDDSFRTWCGITDMDSPSEKCMDNFVYNWKDCTCKKCKQAYKRDIKNFEKQLRSFCSIMPNKTI